MSLPKAGGAIRGLGEKFAANPVTGAPSLNVPIYTSPGRSGFGPHLSLSYLPGAGNGPFGLEWALSVPAISRKTDKGLPRYDDANASDTFLLSDAEDLVPALQLITNPLDNTSQWVSDHVSIGPYTAWRYRPRVEGLFARIERLQHSVTGDVFWRATTKDNVTSVYGQSLDRRIADPADPTRVFKWLLEGTYDDKGNLVIYEYKAEDLVNVDPGAACEAQRRDGTAPIVNRYLKYIRYGTTTSYRPDPELLTPPSEAVPVGDWLFHVVFDYGEHDLENPTVREIQPWPARQDPFSTYRPGFEIRAYRLCQRVLMFHTITQLDTQPYLVRSTSFGYAPSPVLTQLTSVSCTGYLKGSQQLTLPPVEFTYTDATVDPTVHTMGSSSMENLPSGLDGTRYDWIDLDSEGLSGVLSEQAGTWFYKRNLGQGALAPVEVVANRPSLANLASGRQQILDLASNGHKSLVEFGQPVSGYYARTQRAGDQGAQWDSFIPFVSCPVVDWQDRNLRMIDLVGNGRADILITDDEFLTWYPSLAGDGFGPAEWTRKPYDEAQGPALVFADGTQSLYLADMSGDGLTDLVRIRNGEICYWPNLGYGHFGARVVMDAPPVFDQQDQFDQRRVKLGDIDGSGTTDIVYIGSDVVRFWLNQSGNSWSAAHTLQQFPQTDDLSTVSVVDLLGTGTSCIVWSSPLPQNTRQPMRYVDLMSGTDFDGSLVHGRKPYLLNSVKNNLGAETRIQYLPATRFYVDDWLSGNPWITRIPFPLQVVAEVESHDAVSDSSLVSRYAYHHGYYDAEEREFRGFGLVEQWDTQAFADFVGAGLFGSGTQGVVAGGDADLHLPPVHTKTWYHTGAYRDRTTIVQLLQGEYYQGDAQAAHLPDITMPAGLSAQEERECCRALKGMVLRQEIYADDGGDASTRPYSASEHTYAVRRAQPVQDNRYAVVYAYGQESIDYHYERNPADPRVGHTLTLAVDDYGNVTKSVAVGYPRRTAPQAPPVLSEQGQLLMTYTESDVINAPDTPGSYRHSLPAETRAYEITGITFAAGRALFTLPQLASAIAGAGEIQYEQAPTTGAVQKRLLKRGRTLYYSDDLATSLPLGQAGARALPYQQYAQAFTPGLLTQVYGTRVDATVLGDGGYAQQDGVWWTQSGRQYFDPTHFYLPTAATDPFGNTTSIEYDGYALLATQITDPFQHSVMAASDYRLLRPWQITDLNGNVTGAESDALGMVVATWETGKNGEGSSQADPSVTLDYSIANWMNTGQPNYVHAREREVYDPATRWLETYTYSDGFGRVIQAKVQAEPGAAPARDGNGVLLAGQTIDTTPNPRWVGSGRTIFDNKGNPVKQYEPFFSADYSYETEAQLVQIGVTPVLRYDPLSRLIRTDLPDGSYSKVAFDPWKQVTWDPNDTLAVTDPVTGATTHSRWYSDRSQLPPSDPEYQALQVSLPHADTPTTVHLDTLGRTFLTIADNGASGAYATRVKLDIEGNQLTVTDARSNTAFTTDYDQLNRPLHTVSADAGEHWALAEVAGKPLQAWDARGYNVHTTYDELRRVVAALVSQNNSAPPWLAESITYGERAPTSANVAANNLLGRVYQLLDGAGVVINTQYDFKGNLLSASRQVIDLPALLRRGQVAPFVVDWTGANAPPIESTTFITSTMYDALNRPTTITHDVQNPPPGVPAVGSSAVRYRYNEARLLQVVDAQVNGAATWTPYVSNIDHNARGQRTLIHYGNGAQTAYTYDEQTFRLTRLRTTRPSGLNGLASQIFVDSTVVQDLHYTYDPSGNITRIQDAALADIFYNNQQVKPIGEYTYDAIYRLLQASGREHVYTYPRGLIPSAQYDPFDAERCNLTNPNDLQALQSYAESYVYDPVGNITTVSHAVGGQVAWTRLYNYATQSNRLLSTSLPGDPAGTLYSDTAQYSAKYAYADLQGNMTAMPHLPQMTWDFKNQLQQVTLLGTGGTAYYLYDSAGQRVLKVWMHNGLVEKRVYAGGCERYLKTSAGGGPQVVRDSLHVMDDTRRICLIETTAVDTSQPALTLPPTATRYQLGNLLDSAALELDEGAAIISYEEYYPYGSTSYQAGASAAETSLKRYRYTGKERDGETGLYYHGARYYACWLCRWTSPDPAGMVDGANLYSYAQDSPMFRVDPNGTATKPPVPVPGKTPYNFVAESPAYPNALKAVESKFQGGSLEKNLELYRSALSKLPQGPQTVRGTNLSYARSTFDDIVSRFYRLEAENPSFEYTPAQITSMAKRNAPADTSQQIHHFEQLADNPEEAINPDHWVFARGGKTGGLAKGSSHYELHFGKGALQLKAFLRQSKPASATTSAPKLTPAPTGAPPSSATPAPEVLKAPAIASPPDAPATPAAPPSSAPAAGKVPGTPPVANVPEVPAARVPPRLRASTLDTVSGIANRVVGVMVPVLIIEQAIVMAWDISERGHLDMGPYQVWFRSPPEGTQVHEYPGGPPLYIIHGQPAPAYWDPLAGRPNPML